MTVINTNMKSLIAANALKVNNRAMSDAMERLSTGSRINSAADDAAGLAVTQSMTAQIRGLNMAVKNANDGISLAQTAEGSMIEISNMLQRMRELAVQSATGTLDNTQRGYLNTEFSQLGTQITDVISKTTWNGLKLLQANDTTGDVSFTIQTGANSGDTTMISVSSLTGTAAGSVTVSGIYAEPTSSGLATNRVNISQATYAQSSIAVLDTALGKINSSRATLGAVVNRLTSAADNLTNVAQNLTESRSRILDTDYAAATTELARTQIIQQAGTAVLAQANQQPQSVLALLR